MEVIATIRCKKPARQPTKFSNAQQVLTTVSLRYLSMFDHQSLLATGAQFGAGLNPVQCVSLSFALSALLKSYVRTVASLETISLGFGASDEVHIRLMATRSDIDAADMYLGKCRQLHNPRSSDDQCAIQRWNAEDAKCEHWNGIKLLFRTEMVNKFGVVGTDSLTSETTKDCRNGLNSQWSRARHKSQHENGMLIVKL